MSGIHISDKNRYTDNNPFLLSRAALEEFIDCPCCFYVKRNRGIKHPESYPLSFNNRIDKDLKKLFDVYRSQGKNHPLMEEQLRQLGMPQAIPFKHPNLEEWRKQNHGLQYKLAGTQVTLLGLPDDIWYDRASNELIVVDYKATCKDDDASIDGAWQESFKRQVSIYQYILQGMIDENPHDFPLGCKVSSTAYFLYLNGGTEHGASRDLLLAGMDFRVNLIPFDRAKHRAYKNINWVSQVARAAINCLRQTEMPAANEKCDFCQYYALRAREDNLNTSKIRQKRYNVRLNESRANGVSLYTSSQELADEGMDAVVPKSSSSAASAAYPSVPESSGRSRAVNDAKKDKAKSSYMASLMARMSDPIDPNPSAAYVPAAAAAFTPQYQYIGTGLGMTTSVQKFNSLESQVLGSRSAQSSATTSKRQRMTDAASAAPAKDNTEPKYGYLKIKRFDD